MNNTQIRSFINACIMFAPDCYLAETDTGFLVTVNSANKMSLTKITEVAQNCLNTLKAQKDSEGIDSLINALKTLEEGLKAGNCFETIYKQAKPSPLENLPLVLWKKIAEFNEPKQWARNECVNPLFKTNMMRCKIWQSEADRLKLEQRTKEAVVKHNQEMTLIPLFNSMMHQFHQELEMCARLNKKDPIFIIKDPLKLHQAIMEVLKMNTPLARRILEDILRKNISRKSTEKAALFGFMKLIPIVDCSKEWFLQNFCAFWSFNDLLVRKEIIRELLQRMPVLHMPYSYALLNKYLHLRREFLDIETALAILDKCASVDSIAFSNMVAYKSRSWATNELGVTMYRGKVVSLLVLAAQKFSSDPKCNLVIDKLIEKGHQAYIFLSKEILLSECSITV